MFCLHDWWLVSKLSSLPQHYGQRFILFLHTKDNYVRYCRKCGKQEVNMGEWYFWKWQEIWNLKESDMLEVINWFTCLSKEIQDKYSQLANDDIKTLYKTYRYKEIK